MCSHSRSCPVGCSLSIVAVAVHGGSNSTISAYAGVSAAPAVMVGTNHGAGDDVDWASLVALKDNRKQAFLMQRFDVGLDDRPNPREESSNRSQGPPVQL